MTNASKLDALLGERPITLRELLIAEYDNVIAARAKAVSWQRISAALGHTTGAVYNSWLALERQITAGDLPRPGTISVGSPSNSGSPSNTGSPSQTSSPSHSGSPAQVDAPPRKTAGQIFREKSAEREARGEAGPEPVLSGIEKLRAAGVDVSHL